jgi:hypothetical protein
MPPHTALGHILKHVQQCAMHALLLLEHGTITVVLWSICSHWEAATHQPCSTDSKPPLLLLLLLPLRRGGGIPGCKRDPPFRVPNAGRWSCSPSSSGTTCYALCDPGFYGALTTTCLGKDEGYTAVSGSCTRESLTTAQAERCLSKVSNSTCMRPVHRYTPPHHIHKVCGRVRVMQLLCSRVVLVLLPLLCLGYCTAQRALHSTGSATRHRR